MKQIIMGEEEKRLMLKEQYEELRWYRSKEYQTFLFSVSVIGIGYSETFKSRMLTLVLLGFCIIIIRYILRNLSRMEKIKKTIVSIQEELKISEIEGVKKYLKPQEWLNKPWCKHLGTSTYIYIIAAEMMGLILYSFYPYIITLIRLTHLRACHRLY